jgi:hypothetical protein
VTRERLLLIGVLLLGCALMAEALWRGPLFPSNDGPHHVFGAYARAHLDDADKNYAAYLTPNAMPTSNGFPDLFTVFEPLLGVRDAERATLTVLCALFLVGCVTLSAQLHPKRAWLGFVSGAAALGWSLFHGFYPFVGGVAAGLFVLALGLRASTRKQRALFAIAMLLVGTLHFLACAAVGAVVVLARVWGAPGDRARELGRVALSGIPAIALVAYATSAKGLVGDPDETLPFVYRAFAATLTTLGGATWRQAAFGGVMLLGLVSAAMGWRARPAVERALLVVSLGALAMPLLLPWTFFGWQHGAVRGLALTATLGIALVPMERLPPRACRAAAVACVVFFIAATLSARATLERAARDLADVEAALEDPSPGGYRLSAILVQPSWIAEAGLFRWDPLRGLGSRFAVNGGGLPAYAQTLLPQIHPVLVRADLLGSLPTPPVRSEHQSRIRGVEDSEKRRALLGPVILRAREFESVLVFERPEDHALWKATGFTVVSERGRVLQLAVPEPATPPPPPPPPPRPPPSLPSP